MDAGHVLRGLRAAVFAAVCVLLAALGHMAMSDAAIPGRTLLLAGAATAAGSWCLAGRERGPLLVGLLTVGTQAALHTAFSLGQAAAVAGGERAVTAREWARTWLCGAQGMSAADIDAAQRMRRQLPPLHEQLPGMSGVHGMSGMHGSGGVHAMGGGAIGMAAAHLLVALLSAWWLWGGERAAFRLVRAVSARVFTPLVLVLRVLLPAAPPGVRAARQEPRRAVQKLLLAHARSLRGPPREPAVIGQHGRIPLHRYRLAR
ncbi:PE-PGRS family protein [Streptomyces sp. NPDC048650]|uniref:PE-PGRS family protein n=1 Tax=unclassified Streptomyces TaxID=2593676 RepID=UPI003712BC85